MRKTILGSKKNYVVASLLAVVSFTATAFFIRSTHQEIHPIDSSVVIDKRWILSKNQEELIVEFLRTRSLIIPTMCVESKCFVEESCFDHNSSVWWPTKCNSSNSSNSNSRRKLNILLIGDSRMRQLFLGLAESIADQSNYQLERQDPESLRDITNEFPLHKLRLPNYKAEGQLQANFRYRVKSDSVEHSDDGDGSLVLDLLFLWNPKLQTDAITLLKAQSMEPDLIIYGSGLWYLAEGGGFKESVKEKYVENLSKFSQTAMKVCQEKNCRLLFALQEVPVRFNHGRYDANDVNLLNNVAREVIRKVGGANLQMLDSHFELQKYYAELCNTALISDDPSGLWLCSSENHSGLIITKHIAQLILRWALLH